MAGRLGVRPATLLFIQYVPACFSARFQAFHSIKPAFLFDHRKNIRFIWLCKFFLPILQKLTQPVERFKGKQTISGISLGHAPLLIFFFIISINSSFYGFYRYFLLRFFAITIRQMMHYSALFIRRGMGFLKNNSCLPSHH